MAYNGKVVRAAKVQTALERGYVAQTDESTYEVIGTQGDLYRVRWPNSRPVSCDCPAGSIWGRNSLHRYGKFVCWHIAAVAETRRG